jgi:site-specific recombinase XerD
MSPEPSQVSPISNIAEQLDRLRDECTRLTRGLRASSTLVSYAADFRAFDKWCRAVGRDPLPATPETLCLFIAAQVAEGRKLSTACRRVHGVAWTHKIHGHTPPLTDEVHEILNGARRVLSEQPRQMTPLTVEQLREVAALLTRKGGYLALRSRAILVIGFLSALRRENLSALNLTDLLCSDEGLVIHVRREKQDQKGRGRCIGLPASPHAATCPVSALRDWLHQRGDAPGSLFTSFNPPHHRLSSLGIYRTVKEAVLLVGLDAKAYGAHSLRAGFVTAAGEAGVNHLLIASQSGHRSLATLQRYFRRTNLLKSNPCHALGL